MATLTASAQTTCTGRARPMAPRARGPAQPWQAQRAWPTARPSSAGQRSACDGARRRSAPRWRGSLALWRRPHRRTGDGRGKRGGAHRHMDGGAARRRRWRHRVTRREWTSASAARWRGGDRQRPTGTREKISADGGARDAMAQPHSLAHGWCRRLQTERSGWRGEATSARSERRCAVGTPARGPDTAFNARARCGAWQPCGNGTLPGGPSADSGV
jgi:hypothetical protein